MSKKKKNTADLQTHSDARAGLFRNVGHFGHGHFGPDISATDVSATENAKGGRFGQNHKLWVGVCACINV